jgi:hypothetical protein
MTRSGRRASQHPDELRAFIELLRRENVRSYLEIGARHGDTFFEVMKSLPKGSMGVAVDLPGGLWGTEKSKAPLRRAVIDLKSGGYRATAVFGDSRSAGVRQTVMADGPFDAVLIDGDHLYEGVKADWLNYGPMSRIVAFHDIAGEGEAEKVNGNPVEVSRLWSELKADYRHAELIGEATTMGIGVLWRE